jgi:predicted enzyme related to lactoylglutathione lyase
MKRVTGIGGVFFRSKDPSSLKAWYAKHLGVPVDDQGFATFLSCEGGESHRPARTAWAAFEEDTDYFGRRTQQWMLNYRVENLDALLEALRNEGVEIVPQREDYDFGRFAWIVDPEGNRIELWEPIDAQA